jgi:hypothetical protein
MKDIKKDSMEEIEEKISLLEIKRSFLLKNSLNRSKDVIFSTLSDKTNEISLISFKNFF